VRYVDVSVATIWASPTAPRATDRPALGNPVNMRAWSGALNTGARLALVGRIETQALFGEPVRVLSQRGSWTQIAVVDQPSPMSRLGYPGWVPTRQITSNSEFGSLLTGQIAVVRTPIALLSGGTRSLELSFGTRLPVRGVSGDTVIVATPAGSSARLAGSDVSLRNPPAAVPAPTGAELVAMARRFLGVRYLWGGTSAFGFDCSGFVSMIYRAYGTVIPRDAYAQARAGVPVARPALKPGDLVFFATDPPSRAITHVAMYIGDGRIIESPNSSSAVRVISLSARSDEYVTARRFLPQAR
jgi:cell wall-associated NlpC family hydrolase